MQPHPRPENPEKGGNPHAGEYGPGFLPLSPFSGTGAAQNAISNGAAAALAAVRAYRRIPPPKPPRAPRHILQAARRGFGAPGQAPVAPLGVPLDWCEGVALLAARTAPPMILPGRWAVLAATSARLLQDHGAELHGAGWPALALFGLDRSAPASYPPGWGLVWLLGEHGEVLDISAGVIWLRWKPDGARMAFYRQHGTGRAGTVLAWLL